jgi:hypothetical protein
MGWPDTLASDKNAYFRWELPHFRSFLRRSPPSSGGCRGFGKKRRQVMKFIYVMVDKGQRARLRSVATSGPIA